MKEWKVRVYPLSVCLPLYLYHEIVKFTFKFKKKIVDCTNNLYTMTSVLQCALEQGE
jgi:hypothetical protein